eukprot:TRINITY_DN10004_c0_g1_i1.p1 TRINITY_DN10004_c0_g1~~TRINITY_DN10004_c0_g1_i1.p1  ORF type:complete len:147 (-),score=3.17 TRINITY_DN10004_c0_g1_i1:180-599(-)
MAALVGVFFLTGCNENSDVVAARMTGAVAGGMLGSAFSDGDHGATVAGAFAGSLIAGEVVRSQSQDVSYQDINSILDYGRAGARYVVSSADRHLVIIPGPLIDINDSGSLLTCRTIRWLHDGLVHSSRYCLVSSGWRVY